MARRGRAEYDQREGHEQVTFAHAG